MTLKDFKLKWKNEIKLGIVKFPDAGVILADRFVDHKFVCDRPTINKIQADIRRMNYFRVFDGEYVKKTKHYKDASQYRDFVKGFIADLKWIREYD